MNTINGRTPEEIKKLLANHKSYTFSAEALFADALAYIQQLERERDAAVADLKSVVASNLYSGEYCKYCKHNEPDGQCHHHCIPYSSEWGWKWRGVQEVE